jgi:UDPglucose--hexose-1-phosphate uridylyltransferase
LADVPRHSSSCPFCPGNESSTPPPSYERHDDAGHWQVRVIPNKYPALTLDAVGEVNASHPALGVHEVIVESARHVDRSTSLSPHELCRVVETYAARLNHWRGDARLAYGLVFKNQGPQAGASLSHLHSQLIALPKIPPAVAAELRRAEEAYNRQRECGYCRLIERERTDGSRIVFEREGFIAFCPYASLQPCEIWLLPTNHQSAFDANDSASTLQTLAHVLSPLFHSLESIIPAASYNMLLRTAPWRAGCDNYYHWRIELLPRLNAVAGFEAATGVFINPAPPEHAAARLRSVWQFAADKHKF